MPQFRVTVDRSHRKIIFDQSATKAAGQRMIAKSNDLIAQEGVRLVRARLDLVLQNPTGYYRSNIAVKSGTVSRAIWDNKVVYGGWLEGVDPRNRTTRFKGYRTFRIIKQELNRQKVRIAQPAINQYIKELS